MMEKNNGKDDWVEYGQEKSEEKWSKQKQG